MVNKGENESTKMDRFLNIPALGRSAALGYLYDERTDEFRNVFAFTQPIIEPIDISKILLEQSKSKTPEEVTSHKRKKNNIALYSQAAQDDDHHDDDDDNIQKKSKYPVGVIIQLDKNASNIDVALDNTYEEKFKNMNISADVKANIMSGMVNVEGSASYLNETNKTSLEVTGILTYGFQSMEEQLQISYDSLNPYYNTALLQMMDATHIVTGIKYGANVSIKFKNTASDDKSKETIKGHLKVELNKVKGMMIEGSGDVNIDNKNTVEKSNFTFSVEGDIRLEKSVPTTHQEVVELIKSVPELMKKQTVRGKGVPIEFSLHPLAKLKLYLAPTEKVNQLVYKIDDAILGSFVRIFDSITEAEQYLNDINDNFKSYPMCVSWEERENISKLLGDFLREKIQFTTSLRKTIISIRSGTVPDSSALSSLFSKYNAQYILSPSKIQKDIKIFGGALKKIDLYKSQSAYDGIQYFGNGSNLEPNLLRSIKDVVYIWYTKQEFTQNDLENYQECQQIFFDKLHKPFNKLFIVDCDFDFPRPVGLNKTVIQQIVHGKTTIQDVNQDLRKSSKLSDSIEMKAIGRFAQIGQIYDAKTDTFLKDRFLKDDYPKTSLKITPNDMNETNIIPSESYEDKFRILGVETELQFSILAGMTPLSRSGKYLGKSIESTVGKEKQRQVRSVLHTRRLNEVEIKLKDETILKSLAIDNVDLGATHFVTKIEYGFNTIFSVQNISPGTSSSDEEASEHLELYVQNLKGILSGIQLRTKPQPLEPKKSPKVKAKAKDKEQTDDPALPLLNENDLKSLDGDFKITIFSDIQGEKSNPDVVDNISELLQYLNHKFIPRLSTTADTKNKMGVPLAYILYPIANLAQTIGALSPYNPYGTLSGADPSSLVKILHEIQIAEDQIKRFGRNMKQCLDFVTDMDFSMLDKIREKYNATMRRRGEDLKQLVKDIKSGAGEKTQRDYETALHNYKKEEFLQSEAFYVGLDPMKTVGEKMTFLESLKGQGIGVLGREKTTLSLDQLLTKTSAECERIYLLYYNPCWVRDYAEEWNKTRSFFLNTLLGKRQREGTQFFVINAEFEHFTSNTITRPAIQEYFEGRLTAESVHGLDPDVNEDAETSAEDALTNITKVIDNKLEQVTQKAEKGMADFKKILDDTLNDFPVRWVKAPEGNIPNNAVEGGSDVNGKTYIIRAYDDLGNCIPGKYHCEQKCAYFPFGKEEKISSNYEFLTAPPDSYSWCIFYYNARVDCEGSTVPRNAIRGGEENGTILYVGRCSHSDNKWITPGKVFAEQGKGLCSFSYAGEVTTDSKFQVIVTK